MKTVLFIPFVALFLMAASASRSQEPSQTELDSIRQVLNGKNLSSPATVEDVLNASILTKRDAKREVIREVNRRFVTREQYAKNGDFARFRRGVDSVQRKLDGRMTDLEVSWKDQDSRVKNVEGRQTSLDGAVSAQASELSSQAKKVEEVRGRVDDLEVSQYGRDVDDCPTCKKFAEEAKRRILQRLAGRLGKILSGR